MMAPQQDQQLIIPLSPPTSTNSAISTISTAINTPSPSPPIAPLVIPTVKTETYTCDDFLAPTLGSTSNTAGLGFGLNLDFNYQSLLLDNSNCGFLFDDQFLGAFYSSPHETKPHGCS